VSGSRILNDHGGRYPEPHLFPGVTAYRSPLTSYSSARGLNPGARRALAVCS
jgi:hypothetical protein